MQLHMSRISRQKPLTPRSASPKRFLPPFGIGTPEAESLKQDVRKYVARVRKTSINELLLNFGARFNEIFWRKKKAKQGSWKAWLQTIHGIELDLKTSPYPAIACSCASDMYAFLDTLSPVPVAEKDTHNASESWGHAQRSLEKEVRNCLSRNGPTSIDKMQKDFGDRYRAVHPPPWSFRRWLSGLSGVKQVTDFTQLRGQGHVDHGKNTDRAPKQCYTSTPVLPPKVHSIASSKCQRKRSPSKGKHKRSRCHKRSRSHRKRSRSRRDRSRSTRDKSRSRGKRMRSRSMRRRSKQRRSRSMRRRSRGIVDPLPAIRYLTSREAGKKRSRSKRKHSRNRHNQKQKLINTAVRVKRSGGSPVSERTGCHSTYSRSSSITPCSTSSERGTA